jgi:hypothetical protein
MGAGSIVGPMWSEVPRLPTYVPDCSTDPTNKMRFDANPMEAF